MGALKHSDNSSLPPYQIDMLNASCMVFVKLSKYFNLFSYCFLILLNWGYEKFYSCAVVFAPLFLAILLGSTLTYLDCFVNSI